VRVGGRGVYNQRGCGRGFALWYYLAKNSRCTVLLAVGLPIRADAYRSIGGGMFLVTGWCVQIVCLSVGGRLS
jgi:hypothetical protein